MSGPTSSACSINKSYNLTKTNGLPKSCSNEQKEEILLKALDSSNADQKYAALSRLIDSEAEEISPQLRTKLLSLFKTERDVFVLSNLVQLAVKYKIKEAVPLMVRLIDDPDLNVACADALAELGDPSAIPALQASFKLIPSLPTALALLKLGDPTNYLENFAKDDLALLAERDTKLVYHEPLWKMLLGSFKVGLGLAIAPASASKAILSPYDPSDNGGPAAASFANLNPKDSFKTEIVPTVASTQKGEAKERPSLMLDTFARNKDPRVIPILFGLIKKLPPGIAEKIIPTFNEVVSPGAVPLLLAGLKSKPTRQIAQLILPALHQLFIKDQLDPQTKKDTIEAIIGLLDDGTIKNLALIFLAEVGERSIIPRLIKTINETPYCAAEVESLARLRISPEEFEPLFINILKDAKYATESQDARLAAAMSLAVVKRPGGEAFLEKIVRDGSSAQEDVLLALEGIDSLNKPALLPAVMARLEMEKKRVDYIEAHYQPPLSSEITLSREAGRRIRFICLVIISRLASIINEPAQKAIEAEAAYFRGYLRDSHAEEMAISVSIGQRHHLLAPERYKFAAGVESLIRELEKKGNIEREKTPPAPVCSDPFDYNCPPPLLPTFPEDIRKQARSVELKTNVQNKSARDKYNERVAEDDRLNKISERLLSFILPL